MHVIYPKIHRLGSEENDGILIGTVTIQEKVDGANTSIWKEIGDKPIHCGSRTQDVSEKGFNGFCEYVGIHRGINDFLTDHPNKRLFGEWLVRHTIDYNETSYKQFYLFDIMDEGGSLMCQDFVEDCSKRYSIKMVEKFAVLENPTEEDILRFVGKTVLGNKGEGVVIKNEGFINKFGNKVYAKIVTQEFKEDSALVFGGNNKHSDTYWEMYVVNKFITLGRVQKVMNKLQPIIDKRLDMEHTARIINTVYHDMITEEIWDIQKSVPKIDFKALKKLSIRKAAKIYHDILNNHISVAYEETNNDEGVAR